MMAAVLRAVVVAMLCVLALAGCGDDDAGSSATTGSTTVSTTPTPATTESEPPDTLKDAIIAPEPTLMEPGDELTVSAEQLSSTGFQAACIFEGRRANVESIPGQDLPPGELVSFPGGPRVEVERPDDGSVVVHCKR